MTEKTKHRKLSHEILGLLIITFLIALFLFEFLSITGNGIAIHHIDGNNILLTEMQEETLILWITNLSFFVALLFFIILFLILLGQKLSYIKHITNGVDALREHRMDHEIQPEGNNELTRLAETINYLSATEKEIKAKEQAIQREKDELIRTLSHDIRTPLTSIISYSEFLLSDPPQTPEEQREQIALIRQKAEQIKELTNILLDGSKRHPEYFENIGLLVQQLTEELEDSLEDGYVLSADIDNNIALSGNFDVNELRRIFDNLASNINKYADPQKPIRLSVFAQKQSLILQQSNFKRERKDTVESYHLGLSSIQRIALNYHGKVTVEEDEEHFTIIIELSRF